MKNLSEKPSVKFHEKPLGGDSLFHADKRADRRKNRGAIGWSENCYSSVLCASAPSHGDMRGGGKVARFLTILGSRRLVSCIIFLLFLRLISRCT